MELLVLLVWLGVAIFYIMMAIRLVRAVEEIANRSGVTTRILEDIARQIKKPDSNQ